ncbi:hypothetical protein NDU88_006742 [Pleurodeles waltl]|uniref:Uncharacterized protein n=1 Tax=Pleurodeles waltl TaxID=8319 RepID=A0AAV7MDX1_PLEWA|nr:hypothetical protein NDU88_006742 [Pleurodeles waltl]
MRGGPLSPGPTADADTAPPALQVVSSADSSSLRLFLGPDAPTRGVRQSHSRCQRLGESLQPMAPPPRASLARPIQGYRQSTARGLCRSPQRPVKLRSSWRELDPR